MEWLSKQHLIKLNYIENDWIYNNIIQIHNGKRMLKALTI